MSCGCCSIESTPPKADCPGCGQQCETISHTTLIHQLRTPWRHALEGDFYFCNSPECDTVYFSTSGGQFDRHALRQQVGQKSTAPDRMLCYCFDIRYSDLDDAQSPRDFVIDKTRGQLCACEERNPSGRCCLRDFPKMEKSS